MTQPTSKTLCNFDPCERVAMKSVPLCAAHNYQRRQGKELKPIRLVMKGATQDARLKGHSKRVGECLIWQGAVMDSGYGWAHDPRYGKQIGAHRSAYETWVGPIPRGMIVDHVCYEKLCIEPKHLQVVTPVQNSENRGKLNPSNTSGVRGVGRRRGKWRVRAKHLGVDHFGGDFDDLAEAEKAAIALRNRLHSNNRLDWSTNA